MPLPKQVIEAGRLADEAEKKFKEQRGLGPDGEVLPPETIPIVEPESAAAEPEGDAKPPKDDEEILDWEQEYKTLLANNDRLQARHDTLQGKYNAEVPRLQNEVRQLQAVVDDTSRAAPTDDSGSGTEEIPADITEMFGEGFADFMQKDRARAQAEIRKLNARLDGFAESGQQSARDTYFNTITEAHSDWRTLDRTNAFIGFLHEVDPSSGLKRGEIIDKAGDRFDPAPVIHQLNIFKERAKPGKGKERQVVPGESGGAPAPVDTSQVRYNRSTVDEFNKKAARLAPDGYTATEEYKRLDRLYTDAALEGRINEGR